MNKTHSFCLLRMVNTIAKQLIIPYTRDESTIKDFIKRNGELIVDKRTIVDGTHNFVQYTIAKKAST